MKSSSSLLPRVLFALPGFHGSGSLNLKTFLALVRFARIAIGNRSKPCRMMRPCPFLSHSAISHRAKSAWDCGSAFVDMNYESSQHQQCGEIMNDVAHGYQPTPHDMVKPHQQPGSQKQDSAQ